MRRLTTLVGIATAWLVMAAPASAAEPRPFGHDCTPRSGVLFCPTKNDQERVPSFDEDENSATADRVPLDVDVTLPAGTQANQPLPTIVMLHGYGGSKEDFETDTPEPPDSVRYHYNNNFYAKRGYAVVNYSARGFGRSCGQPDSRTPASQPPGASCNEGWVRLADQRFEARDTQYLLGRLVDEKITNKAAMGTTGISYGGGQSIELALLRDRIRKPNSDFAEWKSEAGTSLSLSAAFPRWPWSDLVYSLLPNGRYLDDRPTPEEQSRTPLGISIKSYTDGLYASGKASGYYCGDGPPGVTPCPPDEFRADINQYYARIMGGEPYDGDPTMLPRRIADEIFDHHQGFGLPADRPAPLLLNSGWTDDLFPVSESLRLYNQLRGIGTDGRATNPDADVALQLGDLGHPRGSNKDNTNRDFNDEGAAFFDTKLRNGGQAPAPGSVKAYTQTCPAGAPGGGPFVADDYPALHPDTVPFGSAGAQQVGVKTPANSAFFDPIASGQDPCRRAADESDPDVAEYRTEIAEGFTMLGRPTVEANIAAAGLSGELVPRLWDVAPDGQQTLVSRGAYRLTANQTGSVRFQLTGNGYCFEAGHEAKLELSGADVPYLRPSNLAATTTVTNLSASLPGRNGPCQSRFESSGAGDDRGGSDERDDDGDGDEDDSDDGDSGPPARPSGASRGLPLSGCTNERRGTPRGDRIRGTRMGDRLLGLDGRDKLWGLAGKDCLFGGSSADGVSGGPGPDVLSGEDGADRLRGASGSDRISGGSGDDALSGGSGSDWLLGGPGSDRISGGAGDDAIDVRGGGRDRVSCGSGRDRVRLDRSDTARGC